MVEIAEITEMVAINATKSYIPHNLYRLGVTTENRVMLTGLGWIVNILIMQYPRLCV